jgi:hypothetical protein
MERLTIWEIGKRYLQEHPNAILELSDSAAPYPDKSPAKDIRDLTKSELDSLEAELRTYPYSLEALEIRRPNAAKYFLGLVSELRRLRAEKKKTFGKLAEYSLLFALGISVEDAIESNKEIKEAHEFLDLYDVWRGKNREFSLKDRIGVLRDKVNLSAWEAYQQKLKEATQPDVPSIREPQKPTDRTQKELFERLQSKVDAESKIENFMGIPIENITLEQAKTGLRYSLLNEWERQKQAQKPTNTFIRRDRAKWAPTNVQDLGNGYYSAIGFALLKFSKISDGIYYEVEPVKHEHEWKRDTAAEFMLGRARHFFCTCGAAKTEPTQESK